MRWSERFATGIPALDEQHKMLFRMSEDYRYSIDRGQGQRTYGVMLDSLSEYARAHFRMEEDCMWRYSCPVADENGRAHREFTETLAGYKRRFADVGFLPDDAQALVDFLDAWLMSHIGTIDARLRPCVEASS